MSQRRSVAPLLLPLLRQAIKKSLLRQPPCQAASLVMAGSIALKCGPATKQSTF
jgi:hypothetical protein